MDPAPALSMSNRFRPALSFLMSLYETNFLEFLIWRMMPCQISVRFFSPFIMEGQNLALSFSPTYMPRTSFPLHVLCPGRGIAFFKFTFLSAAIPDIFESPYEMLPKILLVTSAFVLTENHGLTDTP